MFDKTNITEEEYFTFYNRTSGVYEAYVEMIKNKKEELLENQNYYKDSKLEFYKKQIKYLNDSIKELEFKKELLEFLYNGTFNKN